jgi:hypothetical protein
MANVRVQGGDCNAQTPPKHDKPRLELGVSLTLRLRFREELGRDVRTTSNELRIDARAALLIGRAIFVNERSVAVVALQINIRAGGQVLRIARANF